MDRRRCFRGAAWFAAFALLWSAMGGTRGWSQEADAKPRVILVMTDGLRWQEVFRGADKKLSGVEGVFQRAKREGAAG